MRRARATWQLGLALVLPALSGAVGAPSPLTPLAKPAFPVHAPASPSQIKAEFSLATGDKGGKPMANLSWKASQARTYFVRGYGLLKKGPTDPDFILVQGGVAPLAATFTSEAVEVGKAYEFAVVAIDAKGNSSPRSQEARLDLSNLDPSLLAPRAPLGLTASSQRSLVKLSWQQAPTWYEPVSSYMLFRDGELIRSTLTETAYTDLSPSPKTLFTYHIQAVDASGRRSLASLTATGQATGTLNPAAPLSLSLTVKTEKAVLSWEPSQPGTAAISSYILKRIIEPGPGETQETVKKPEVLDRSRSSYTESVEGGHFYRYELKAVDAEGNSSESVAVRAWVEGKPFNKTSLLLMPTAYSNNADRDTGVNINVLFDYFIGSLFYQYSSDKLDKTGLFQPLQVGTVGGDLKATWIEETWLSPAIATGFYGAALINFGSQNSAQTVGVSSSGGGITTLGDLYIVASKRLGSKTSAIHAGYMRGKLADGLADLAKSAGQPDWEITLRHLSPGKDYPELLNRLVDKGLSVQMPNTPHLLFAGIQFPFTVPLGFTRWKTGLKLEALLPVQPEPMQRNPTITNVSDPPLMVNFHIDNLPLFGFEFSVFSFQGGWEWIAFYHIPDLTWSW